MNETNFTKGDVVYLKSGGPLMTVTDLGDDGSYVTCIWFVEGKDVTQQTFPAETLALQVY